jgi:ADP-heptose:LPS heptosyltransferase
VPPSFRPNTSVAVARFDGLGDHLLSFPFLESLLSLEEVTRVDFYIPEDYQSVLSNFHHEKLHWIPVKFTSINARSRFGILGQWLRTTASGIRTVRSLAQSLDIRYDIGFAIRPETDYATNSKWFLRELSHDLVGFDFRKSNFTEFPDRQDWKLLDYPTHAAPKGMHESQKPLLLLSPLVENRKVGLEKLIKWGARGELERSGGRQGKLWIHPFASRPEREIPVHLVRKIASEVSAKFSDAIILGNPSELESIRSELCSGFRFMTLTEALSGEINVSNDAFVGADSGPGHVFAQLGVRGVTLSNIGYSWEPNNYSSPERFCPTSVSWIWVSPKLPLRGCSTKGGCIGGKHNCIASVDIDLVVSALCEDLPSSGCSR